MEDGSSQGQQFRRQHFSGIRKLQKLTLVEIRYQDHEPKTFEKGTLGWAWWLTPIISTLWEAETSGSQSQPDRHGETLSPLKTQKLAKCGGT